jgi:6-pyruvoyltetrahydropterin/6-carboxytetrahydropterin synthase
MYALAIQKEFIAQHHLIGGDWGAENELHSHHYKFEFKIKGRELDQHGYLIDIVDLNAKLDALTSRYRDQELNKLPEFEGLNPSIEHFCRILCQSLSDQLNAPNILAVSVKVWEDEIAWTSFSQELP